MENWFARLAVITLPGHAKRRLSLTVWSLSTVSQHVDKTIWYLVRRFLQTMFLSMYTVLANHRSRARPGTGIASPRIPGLGVW